MIQDAWKQGTGEGIWTFMGRIIRDYRDYHNDKLKELFLKTVIKKVNSRRMR
jgi:S-adenosylmethionine:diacylglycerol 3-amino-3-carboxypropyl transferase